MCSVIVSEHHVQLARRVEKMELSEKDGKPLQSIKVFSDDVLIEFCDHACWSGREQDVVAAFNLKTTYPTFHCVASCSCCGAAVNRATPYATLNIYEAVEESSPWMTSAKMLDDREFAVLCRDCDEPAEAASAEAEDKEPEFAAYM